MSLSGKQRRHLRSLGHHLEPLVKIGKAGLEDGVLAALEQALLDHELVKVRIGQGSPVKRDDAAEVLAKGTGAEVAQILGKSLLLYRPHPESPTIRLPQRAAIVSKHGGPITSMGAAIADDD